MNNNLDTLVRKAQSLRIQPSHIQVGDRVLYDNNQSADVVEVHHDADCPYYTIQFVDGKERQTLGHKLELANHV